MTAASFARLSDIDPMPFVRRDGAGFAASNVMFLSISIWAGFDGEMGDATRTLLLWMSGLIAVPAALYAGRPFFRSAASSLSRGRANMDVPISLAILLALGLSIFET